MTATRPIDVCIIGGGPAGSALALRLTQLGWRVLVLERETFPRRRVGESLSPGVSVLFEALGCGDILRHARSLPVQAVSVTWEGGAQIRQDPEARGQLVCRSLLDMLLLGRVRHSGATVLQPAVFRSGVPNSEGWAVCFEYEGEQHKVFTRFLADGSGRGFATRGRKKRTGRPTLALHAWWPPGRGFPRQPSVVAGDDGWYWGMPLPDGSFSAMLFTDPRQHKPSDFPRLIAASGVLGAVPEPGPPPLVCASDATPWVDEQCVSSTSICVGDSAIALDPLSSTGVQMALQTSLWGAVVVNTLLRKPEAAAAAIDFYRSGVTAAALRHQAWATGYYGLAAAERSHAFWKQRSGEGTSTEPVPATVGIRSETTPLVLCPAAEFRDTPCVWGDFIEVRSALHHPSLERPLAFLGSSELSTLFTPVPGALTAAQLAQAWSDRVPVSAGLRIAAWLQEKGLLVPEAA